MQFAGFSLTSIESSFLSTELIRSFLDAIQTRTPANLSFDRVTLAWNSGATNVAEALAVFEARTVRREPKRRRNEVYELLRSRISHN